MKVLVLPHELTVGGSQRNAIDLAIEMHRRGNEVVVAGPDGPLAQALDGTGVAYAPLYIGRLRPSPRRSRQVGTLIDAWSPHVVHAYEWPSALEASQALVRRPGIGLVTTVMSMEVDAEVLRDVPLLLGTPELRARYASGWRAPVGCCEPPVDVVVDRPDPLAGATLRADLGLDAATPLVAIVSRIATRMKFEGIAAAVRAVGAVQRATGAQLVIAGDGDAMPALQALVREVQADVGTAFVHLLGAQPDPHRVYSAADVVVGMGGSALRAMAHGVPVVVTGEAGFARAVDPTSFAAFAYVGFYGTGDGSDMADPLEAALRPLITDVPLHIERSQWSRAVVVERYALETVADRVQDAYRDAVSTPQTGSRRERRRALRAAIAREVRHHVPIPVARRAPVGSTQSGPVPVVPRTAEEFA